MSKHDFWHMTLRAPIFAGGHFHLGPISQLHMYQLPYHCLLYHSLSLRQNYIGSGIHIDLVYT